MGAPPATVAALTASACFGIACVLQSVGVTRLGRPDKIDIRRLLRLAWSVPYMAGLGLDLLGFVFAVIAMRRLPVFAVEAITASYLAVTAVLARAVLGHRLRIPQWLALTTVTVGVAMLSWSAQAQPTQPVGIALRLSLLTTTLALGVAGWVVDRVVARPGPILAVVGGLAWGLIPLAIRMVRDPGRVAALLSDPAVYTVAASGALGLFLYTSALQRSPVVTATAGAVLGETLLPAAAGIVLLGDQPRAGTGFLALIGFLCALGGGLVLAQYGHLTPPDESAGHTGPTDGGAV